MVTYLSYMKDDKENQWVKELVRDQAAVWTNEVWQYVLMDSIQDVEKYVQEEIPPDMMNWDITVPESLSSLEKERHHFPKAFLIVVADVTMSPLSYLKPEIFPSALILKPMDDEQVRKTIEDALRVFSRRFQKESDEDVFLVTTREETLYIPYEQITYIEAREKKLFIHRGMEEYGCYETLDKVLQQLPDYFQRCHRSYVINMSHVKAVLFSQNKIEMTEGEEIPLSRSYRKQIKERQTI